MMEPSELLSGSYYSYGVRDSVPGIEWFQRFKTKISSYYMAQSCKTPSMEQLLVTYL